MKLQLETTNSKLIGLDSLEHGETFTRIDGDGWYLVIKEIDGDIPKPQSGKVRVLCLNTCKLDVLNLSERVCPMNCKVRVVESC